MAKKKQVHELLQELKAELQADKAIIGSGKTLKALQMKKLKKVFLASNCPVQLKDDLLYYGKLANVPIVELELDNEELGVVCKKNFFIAVIGIGD